MTDITELAQMKGQKVEGSYYLAECTDCGKMYPSNKLNGEEPLFSGDYGECYCPHCNADDAAIGDCGDTAAIAWNYQQGRIDALVEALEKAQRANAAQDDHINQQQDRINKLEEGCKHAAKRINSWRRLAKQSIAEQEKCVDELDAARQRIVELDRKNCELDSLTQRWAVERAENAERIAELESRTVKLPQRHIAQLRKGFNDYHNEMVYKVDEVMASLAAADIDVEVEKIRIVLQELKEDGVLTTYSNGHVEMLPYRIDENGKEYVEMFQNNIELH